MSKRGAGDCIDQTIQSLSDQLKIARSEINNLRQQLKTLTHTHKKDCDEIQQTLADFQCTKCRDNTSQDRAPQTTSDSDISLSYIGVIQTQFPEKRGTPRQPGICSELVAKLTLSFGAFTNPGHALEGLQEFSHMWILYHFHRNDPQHVRAKVAPPRLNGYRTGVFATRSPHRPAPIGLSLVKIDRIVDGTIYFSGVDMVDGTPVIDIKPFIPQYDNPSFNANSSNSGNNSMESNAISNDSFNPSTSITSNSRNMTCNEIDVSNLTIQNESDNGLLEPDLELDNRVLDGDENGGNVPSGNAGIPLNSGNVEVYYNRSASRIGEREAPDGEEEESPQTSTIGNTAQSVDSQIRIPSWIDNPPVSALTVLFKDAALTQLSQLGNEADEKKTIITNVLREDPRSVYLRERLGSHCYVFRISDLNVSCRFNDSNHSVTVYKVFPNSDNADLT